MEKDVVGVEVLVGEGVVVEEGEGGSEAAVEAEEVAVYGGGGEAQRSVDGGEAGGRLFALAFVLEFLEELA